MKVLKFGGTSLAGVEQIKRACDIIITDPERRICVVSAPGKRFKEDIKVTDLLISVATAVLNGKDGKDELDKVLARYKEIADGLEVPEVFDDIKKSLETLLTLNTRDAEGFTDTVKAAGEDNNARVIAAYLTHTGHPAVYVNPGEAGMRLIKEFGVTKFDEHSYEKLSELAAIKEVVIFPGFFGTNEYGDVITFPRGGSDITGAILAAAVNADVYENFTDVDYVYTTNPNIVNNPEPIKEITYQEMRELATAGFEVLQEESLLPVYKKNIPVNIRNTNNPSCPGTMIVNTRIENPDRPVIGIVNENDYACLFLNKYLMNHEMGFGRRLLQILEETGISFTHISTGIDNMSVIFKQDQIKSEGIGNMLIHRLYDELKVDDAKLDYDVSLITIAGKDMSHSVGISSRATKAFNNAGTNIVMISQTSAEVSIIFAVNNNEANAAVRTLYDEFFGH